MAWAEFGEVDSSFSVPTVDRPRSFVVAEDGSFWIGGRQEIVHVSPGGTELQRIKREGRSLSLTPHPKGGVIVFNEDSAGTRDRLFWLREDGQPDEAFDLTFIKADTRDRPVCFRGGDALFLHLKGRLSRRDRRGEMIPGHDWAWASVHHIDIDAEGITHVIGRVDRVSGIRLVSYDEQGRKLRNLAMDVHDPIEVMRLANGHWLLATYEGLARYHADGVRDDSYESPVRGFGYSVRLQRRPDGGILLVFDSGAIDHYTLDEDDDDYIAFVRLDALGNRDKSIPLVVRPGRPLVSTTNEWTYFLDDELLMRMDAVPNEPGPDGLPLERRGGIFRSSEAKGMANATIAAFPRGDGVDDLIIAQHGRFKGLTRLVNSRNANTLWQRQAIRGPLLAVGLQRIAAGRIDGDDLVDLAALYLIDAGNLRASLHWYQCQEHDGVRALRYRGPIKIESPPRHSRADLRLADIDGDGDDDAIGRFGISVWDVMRMDRDQRPGKHMQRAKILWWRNDGVDKLWPKQPELPIAAWDATGINVDDDDGIPATDFRVEDLDLDGDLDLAIVQLSKGLTRTWLENDGKGGFTNHGRESDDEPRDGNVGPPVFGAERLPAFRLEPRSPWHRGRVLGWANVNGDDKPDPIIAYPGYEDDDDDGPTWKRGLDWERGEKEAPLGFKGGLFVLPLAYLLRRRISER